MNLKRPKGTLDIFGGECLNWNFLEQNIREMCKTFGIKEIRTPIFEYKELFKRSIGQVTDVVQKEMFSFFDRGEREYVLKPESTAGTARAFIENKLYADVQPTKLFYIAPSFRDERNQAGRYKQFHQFGVEVFGSFDSACDAEVISFVYLFIQKLQLKNVCLKINSLGNLEAREVYNLKLKAYIKTKLQLLCKDCNERYNKNPLRTLDCKNPSCKDAMKDAPCITENLDEESKLHFESLKLYLDKMGIPYEVDPNIVRGLDYYTKTVFEFICKSDLLGSQSTICGGGRYDNLIGQLGGEKIGAVGFAIGMERILILLEEQGLLNSQIKRPEIYVGAIGDKGYIKAQEIVFNLRKSDIYAEFDIVKRSVKSQLKFADKINAKYVVILGEEEINTGKINLKDMDKSLQKEIKIEDLLKFLKEGGL